MLGATQHLAQFFAAAGKQSQFGLCHLTILLHQGLDPASRMARSRLPDDAPRIVLLTGENPLFFQHSQEPFKQAAVLRDHAKLAGHLFGAPSSTGPKSKAGPGECGHDKIEANGLQRSQSLFMARQFSRVIPPAPAAFETAAQIRSLRKMAARTTEGRSSLP